MIDLSHAQPWEPKNGASLSSVAIKHGWAIPAPGYAIDNHGNLWRDPSEAATADLVTGAMRAL